MINLSSETIVTLTAATNHLPRRRGGKKVNPSTLYRWSRRGLETICVGGTLCTSIQALQRFCEMLTARRNPGGTPPPRSTCLPVCLPKEEVGRRLDEIGLGETRRLQKPPTFEGEAGVVSSAAGATPRARRSFIRTQVGRRAPRPASARNSGRRGRGSPDPCSDRGVSADRSDPHPSE
jgi:hypothetical protein